MSRSHNDSGLVRPALVRYVYIDIVDFSLDRSIEAQSDMLECLGRLVLQAITEQIPLGDQVLLLPTGDGICVCLVNLIHPFDLDLQIALAVLERLYWLNQDQRDPSRSFELRVGVNENQDNLIVDIKGQLNVVGLGVNMAQRVMSVAGASGLFLGPAVYQRLSQRELYRDWLRPVQAIVRHGQRLQCYEYFNPSMACFARRGMRADRPVVRPAPSPPSLSVPDQSRPSTSAPLIDLPLRAGSSSAPRRSRRRSPSFRIGE